MAESQEPDLVSLYRMSVGRGGSPALLRWLAERARCWVGLVEPTGVIHNDAGNRLDQATKALVGEGVRTMSGRRVRSMVTGDATCAVLLFTLGTAGEPDSAMLAAVFPAPPPASLAALLSEATRPLSLCLRVERAERNAQRLELAESRSREAVVHLLINGSLTLAHQVAAVLRPALAKVIRVSVVECPPADRRAVVQLCDELTDGSAWIVRCPIYSHHVIVLTPHSVAFSADSPFDKLVVDTSMASYVGSSEEVALRDTSTGYTQAFHALAVARGIPQRRARFDSRLELATVLGPAGRAWAESLLAPLLNYVPARMSDPTVDELLRTTQSWLSLSTGAVRSLRIHRNTLATRLRRVEQLLGLNLRRGFDQSMLDLALRIHPLWSPGPRSQPRSQAAGAETQASLALIDLLYQPGARQWAAIQLRPLGDGQTDAMRTLQSWLDHDTHLGRTAADLGVSVPAVRKRLIRLEGILGRSLLQAPNARHDLTLAMACMRRDGQAVAGGILAYK